MPAAGRLWDEADLVIAIGTDFDGMMTQNWRMPAPKHLVAINVDAVDASKSYQPDVMIVADAAVGTRALADRAGGCAGGSLERAPGPLGAAPPPGARRARRRATGGGRVPRRVQCGGPERLRRRRGHVHPRLLARRRSIRSRDRGGSSYPVGWGTLGFAFPAAIGAALGSSSPVVSVSGDGGFLFCCGELATRGAGAVPLTAVIVDDGGYGMLRYDQRNAGEEPFGVDLVAPDYEALAALVRRRD